MDSIRKIVSWANSSGIPIWWREAIRMSTVSGELSTEDLNALFNIAQMEAGIIEKNDKFSVYESPVSMMGFDKENEQIDLVSISNVCNVSSLVHEKSISFSADGLTVIYGDNGSGKSSYSRVLKNACLTRGDAPRIMPNVFSISDDSPQATISFRVYGEEAQEYVWMNGADSIKELKSIRVFDSKSANHYVSREDSIEYKPVGIKVLDQLINACKFIKLHAEERISSLGHPPVFPYTSPGCEANKFLVSISPSMTEEIVDKYCASNEEIDSLSALTKELAELQTNTPDELRKKYSRQRQRLLPIKSFIDGLYENLNDGSLLDIKNAFDVKQKDRKSAELIRKHTFEGLPIEGIGTDNWKIMWDSVEKFVIEYVPHSSFPPNEGEHCPTCLQSISSISHKRLSSFHNYLNDQSQVQSNESTKEFERKINVLSALRFDMAPYGAVIDEISQYKPEVGEKIKRLMSDLKNRCSGVISRTPTFEAPTLDIGSLTWLTSQIDNLEVKEKSVKNSVDLEKRKRYVEQNIGEIEGKKVVSSHRNVIIKEIQRKSLLDKYSDIRGKTNPSSITRLSTEVSQSGNIGLLQEYFTQELKLLGFAYFDVSTNTRGSKGKQLLKIRITNRNEPLLDIASEGEQNCIALAGFLSELRVDDRKSAIVFDDPVNSLDHNWRRKFANRIAIEAKDRQVIVFTHDLPFLKMLEEASQEKISVLAITRVGNNSGFPLERPPWDTLKTQARIGLLKDRLPKLRKVYENGDLESYREQAKILYGKKRETWERLIEEWLIKSVVERFSRVVKTQNVRYLSDINSDDIECINSAMTKCSTFFEGHDSASELGIDMPDINELEEDISRLESYFKLLKSRRK